VSSRPRTPSQTVGPYYAIGLTRAPRSPQNELADRSDPASVRLIGQLLDGQGTPIGDGMVEVWDGVGKRWGRSGTDSEGRFSFLVTKPAAGAGEAPRFDVLVFARGMLRHELTRIYFPDEAEANAADPVFAALDEESRATLVAEAEDGALRFDIRMQGDRHTVFFEH
jgi:protocatechuate 3,4-dioxygenase alpha subunit